MSKSDGFVRGLGQPFAGGNDTGSGQAQEAPLGCSRKAMVMVHLLINIGLIVGSVAFFTTAVSWYNERNWLRVCEPCKSVVMFVLVISLFLLLVSILGVLVAMRRAKYMSIVFGICQVILFLLFLAWFIALCVAYAGYFDEYVEKGWKNTVVSDPDTICSLEETLRCTGWDRSCYVPPPQTNTPAPTTAAPTPAPTTAAPTPTPTETPTATPSPAPSTAPPTATPTPAPTTATPTPTTAAPTPAPTTAGPSPSPTFRATLLGNGTVVPGCVECDHKYDVNFGRTCESVIHDSFHSAFLTLLLIGLVGCMVCLLLVGITWTIRRTYDGYQTV